MTETTADAGQVPAGAPQISEVEDALKEALATDRFTLIEVIVPREACSPGLRRAGEELGRQRDKSKREAA